jgi:hypothetical protein
MQGTAIKKTIRWTAVSAAVLVIVLLSSCATAGPAGRSAAEAPGKAQPQARETPMYYGTGSGSTQTAAMNAAKMRAVRKAVQDAVGPATAAAKKQQIEELFPIKESANPYVLSNTMQVIDRSSGDDGYTVTLGIRINLEPVARVLRGGGVFGGKVLPQGGVVKLPDQQAPAVAGGTQQQQQEGADVASAEDPGAAPAEEPEKVDPQQAEIIREIVDNMTYMVYFNENTEDDPFLARTAVGMANKYLSQQGMDYVDMERIEQIKEDETDAYEAETGQSVSILQWIAGKLNADIYIEVSVDSNTEQRDGNYYASASVSMKNFDASTGSGRGSAYYQTIPPAMSTVSEEDALNNAVASATYKATEEAIKQAESFTQKELRRGIQYRLVVQNSFDSRVMRDFAERLGRKVENVQRVSYSPEETVYEVRLIGRITELEDIIYDTAETVDGLEGMYLVYQRGNSITFNSGM